MVNVQGDEPLLEPEIIDQVVAALQHAPDAVYRWACRASELPACEIPTIELKLVAAGLQRGTCSDVMA